MENSSEKKISQSIYVNNNIMFNWLYQETTDYKTLIDHIYTNIPDLINTQ